MSRKKTYDECTAKYKFRYHLKLASPVEEPFYFVYGTIVHKIAELYVENKGKIPITQLAKDVLHGKFDIQENKKCPVIPDDYQKKLQKHLKAVENLAKKIGTDGMVEYQFNYDLDPPNNRCVTGFIDRLIVKEDKGFIIDYKTTKKGKWRVNKETVKDDLQLRMYARVVQRNFGLKAENIKAALYYLEGEDLIAAQFSEESLLKVEEELKNSYIKIELADPDKVWGNVGWHCKQCSYNSICPFFNSQGTVANRWDGNLDNI